MHLEEADDCNWVTINGNHVCMTAGHGGHGREAVGHALSPEASGWLASISQHPEILKGKALIKGTATDKTYQNSDGIWQADRAALHDKIVAGILNPNAMPTAGTAPTAILFAGAGGSGKTTALGQFVPGGMKSYTVIKIGRAHV